jgi:hypothetical protein
MGTIIVTLGEPKWTLNAMHLACALARNTARDVLLLRMNPVTHPSYLGADVAPLNITSSERALIRDYAHTAEDYGVSVSLALVNYVDFVPGLAQAAENANADVIFATLPGSRIPYLRRMRLWNLRRQLKPRALYTLDLDTTIPEWKPTITVVTAEKEAAC